MNEHQVGDLPITPLDDFETYVEERRRSTSAMMWQVPALSVAAQAFLYGTAFDPDATNTARLLVSVVALVTALATLQLLLKHRYHEELYSFALDSSRAKRGVEELYPLVRTVGRQTEHEVFLRWDRRFWLRLLVRDLPSSKLWALVLWGFALVDLAMIANVVFGWEWFSVAATPAASAK